MAKMKIVLGTDHAGFELKNKIKEFLLKEGYEVQDEGAYKYNKEDDFPKFIYRAAKKVAEDPENIKGIVFGGSGQGEAVVANKVKGIRASLYYGNNLDIVKLSRTHNDSNVLSLGARLLTEEEAIEAVKTWLETNFSGKERYQRRVNQIKDLEK